MWSLWDGMHEYSSAEPGPGHKADSQPAVCKVRMWLHAMAGKKKRIYWRETFTQYFLLTSPLFLRKRSGILSFQMEVELVVG